MSGEALSSVCRMRASGYPSDYPEYGLRESGHPLPKIALHASGVSPSSPCANGFTYRALLYVTRLPVIFIDFSI